MEKDQAKLLLNLRLSKYGYNNEKCSSCNNNNEGYMITKDLWNLVCHKLNLSKDSLICLKSSHKAIGRNFIKEDFIECPLNEGVLGFDVKWFIDLQDEYFKL